MPAPGTVLLALGLLPVLEAVLALGTVPALETERSLRPNPWIRGIAKCPVVPPAIAGGRCVAAILFLRRSRQSDVVNVP